MFKPWESLLESGRGAETDVDSHSLMMGLMSHHSAFGANLLPSSGLGPRRPGRPPAQTGTFDPETGALR